MAHNLFIRNDQASMMYFGEAPWHQLGTRLDHPATAAEAIEAAQLNWTVSKVPLEAKVQGGHLPVPRKYAIIRNDLLLDDLPLFRNQDGKKNQSPVLGIAGQTYTPLQNVDAFTFFDPIVGEKAAVYYTAGVIGSGERIWILAKLPDDIRVVGDDITEKFLLLSNSHDGTSAVSVKFTPIRVVCQNTLSQALSQGPSIRIAHTPSLPLRLQQAHRLLGIVKVHYVKLGEAYKRMAARPIRPSELKAFLKDVFPDPLDPDNERGKQRVAAFRAEAERRFVEGQGNSAPGVAGTLWAAYNGVVEFVDYGLPVTGRGGWLNSIWYGEGHYIKARAYDRAVSLLSNRN